MNKMKASVLLLTPLAVALVATRPASAQSLPDGEGRDVYETVCGACHGADIVIGSQGSRARWEETVDAMKNRGASGSDADFTTVVNYLSRYFGMSLNVNSAAPEEIEKELGLTKAESDAIVAKRTAAKIKDFDDLTATPGIDKKKLDLVKSRLKF